MSTIYELPQAEVLTLLALLKHPTTYLTIEADGMRFFREFWDRQLMTAALVRTYGGLTVGWEMRHGDKTVGVLGTVTESDMDWSRYECWLRPDSLGLWDDVYWEKPEINFVCPLMPGHVFRPGDTIVRASEGELLVRWLVLPGHRTWLSERLQDHPAVDEIIAPAKDRIASLIASGDFVREMPNG